MKFALVRPGIPPRSQHFMRGIEGQKPEATLMEGVSLRRLSVTVLGASQIRRGAYAGRPSSPRLHKAREVVPGR